MDDISLRPLLSLSWQSFAYGVGVMGQRLVMYLTLPILTLYLEQAEFGVVSVLIAFFSFVNVISNAGIPAATFRMYNEDRDPKMRAEVLGTSQILFAGYAVLMAVMVWVFAAQISVWLLDDATYAGLIRTISVYLVIYTITYYGQIVLRIQVRPLAKSLHSVLWTLAEYGLAIYFVYLQWSVQGYWWGRLIGSMLALIGVLWLIRHSLYWKFSQVQLSEILKYALPILPATLALWSLRLVDRALITASIGVGEVAIYEVGDRIGMLTGLLTVPFAAAWPQFAFSVMYKPHAPRLYRNVLTFLAVGCTFFGMGVILFRNELVALFATAEYARAAEVIPWLVLSQIAWALYPVLSIGPNITKNTLVLAWITGIAAIVNIGLNLILIPQIGIHGAAIATFVAYALLGVLSYIIGQKSLSFPLDWIRLGKLAMVSILSYGIASQIHIRLTYWSSLSLRLIGFVAVFTLLLVALRFVSWQEMQRLKSLTISLTRNHFVDCKIKIPH